MNSSGGSDAGPRLSTGLALVAVVLGAMLGGFIVAAYFTAPVVTANNPNQALGLFGLTFVVAGLLWLVGLVFVGVPFWIALHAFGLRGPVAAALLGAGSTIAVSILLSLMLSQGVEMSSVNGRASIIEGQRTIHGWFDLLANAGLLALAGVAVALVVRAVSYRRLKPPPAPPSAALTP